jgi:hypothetical protein
VIFVKGSYDLEAFAKDPDNVLRAIPLGRQTAAFGRPIGCKGSYDGPACWSKGGNESGKVSSALCLLDEKVEQRTVMPKGVVMWGKLGPEKIGLYPMDTLRPGT